MHEGFDLDIFLAGFPDQFKIGLSCQNDTLETEALRSSDTFDVVDMHLRRTVQFKIGIAFLEFIVKTKILYQQGIDMDIVIKIRHLYGIVKFRLCQQGIQSYKYPDIMKMGIVYRPFEFFFIKIVRKSPGRKILAAKINGISAVVYGCLEAFKIAGRSK